MKTAIDSVVFGNTGRSVTPVGLGGEGVLRTTGKTGEAHAVIEEALAAGITYFDSARVYRDSELYYGGVWKLRPEERVRVFQASKSASRDGAGAQRDLEETLSRLGTDHLDLWQIHDLRTTDEIREIGRKGGALEVFIQARDEGRVRHIGVTGHHDPQVLTRALREWPVDSVMMPVNPVEEEIGGFLTETLPVAREKGVAVIGMKVLGASHYVLPKFPVPGDLLVRFALFKGVTVAIVGCSSPEEVRVLASAAAAPPLSSEERDRIMSVFRPYARKLAFYRGVI